MHPYIDDLVDAHKLLMVRRAELDAERLSVGRQIETITMTLRADGLSYKRIGALLGVTHTTAQRRCDRMEARLNGEPLPATWRGYKTPVQLRRELEEMTTPLDELVLGDPGDQPSVFAGGES